MKLKLLLFLVIILAIGCKKEEVEEAEPSVNLRIDSIVATAYDVVVYEEVFVTIYATGENLEYLWSTNHGSMYHQDSSTVMYWGCYSCAGLNTIKCEVSNEYGTVSDTIMINVNLEK